MADVSKRPNSETLSSCDELASNKKLCFESSLAGDSNCDASKNELDSLDGNLETKLDSFTRATEAEVGITEYISDHPGFSAVIKERYSDFLVNEIDTQGNVVRLTSLEKPVEMETNMQLVDIIDQGTIDDLEALAETRRSEPVLIKVTEKDKDMRKDLHQAIRKCFHGLESNTLDKDGEKYIKVKLIDKKFKGRRFQPPSGGNYMHFVLYKENRDSMDAISNISSFLRIQSKAFSYAGTKDKRAKTSQLVSVYRLSVDKLLSINDKFNMMKVGNIVHKTEQIKLGDLLGNLFTIILRQLKGDHEVIEKAVQSLSTQGFLNYYGMQRFGTSSVSTHAIGRALLQSDWKSAINLILKPRAEGDENLTESRKIWMETKDANKALRNLRNKSSIEGKLLCGLAGNNENDLVNALNAIPRNTRLMYIHSYQSYIWNKVLSKRIQKYGLKVLVGDLIERTSKVEDSVAEPFSSHKKNSDIHVDFVTEENVDNYSICDILLPLPGHSVIYPKNEIKTFYENFLEEDGMSNESFESKVKTYSLSGAYRKIITVPADVKWEILSYGDVTKPLVLSDLEVLQGVKLDPENSKGPLKALKLEFKLPSSSYATMAARELLKCNTCYSSR